MGCPVRKVVKKGAGVALMRDLPRAEAMIRAVVAQAGCPVTVKFRSGLDQRSLIAPEFAAMAESAGAAAVIVHGRTWVQGFGGQADWDMIGAVKRAVSIPVIGNGDVTSHAEALEMMARTGCDGVMIGRGALGNPWAFDPQGRPPTLGERMPTIQRYLELAASHRPGDGLSYRVKNHVVKFLGGLAGAAKLRQAINAATSVATILDLLQAYTKEEIRSVE
jgi:tRNA-dihydrouridine synthase B